MSLDEYNDKISTLADEAYEFANEAKKDSQDPSDTVEIGRAEDLAERCEALLGIDGLKTHIRELEDEYGREELCIKLTERFADGQIGGLTENSEIAESAVRTSIAVLTEGVVAAPIDGVESVKVENNTLRVRYNGPIRSAGGTGQALSVLVADYVRQLLDIGAVSFTDTEVKRYVEELEVYDTENSLQYMPSPEEIELIIENVPVFLDGMQTTEREVTGYRDINRFNGNRARGGMCLVVGEGIAQKAPKIKRYTDSMDISGWRWLDELIDTEDENETQSEANEQNEQPPDERIKQHEFEPNYSAREEFDKNKKYMKDITAGRPILSEPSKKGGLRLRYGRAKNMGIAMGGYHPATMEVYNQLIAIASQLKTERPGKASGVASVSSIDGPTVRLQNGTVKQLNTHEEAKKHSNAIDEILDAGEVLLNIGEFIENNHPFPPSPYVTEWWEQDYKHATGNDANELQSPISYEKAKNISQEHDIPLHPDHTYLWSNITIEQYKTLSECVQNQLNQINENTFTLPETIKPILEELLIEHEQDENTVTISATHKKRLQDMTNLKIQPKNSESVDSVHEIISDEIDCTVLPRVTVRIGARLGRPEKGKPREMSPKVHSLFPVGDSGGKQRNIMKAAENDSGTNKNFDEDQDENEITQKGVITADLEYRKCTNNDCLTETWKQNCPDCGTQTEQIIYCYHDNCSYHEKHTTDEIPDECPDCTRDSLTTTQYQHININNELQQSKETTKTRETHVDGKVKGVQGLTSKHKRPEPLEKGLLRAKHNVSTFRDGTSRYDVMDATLTHFTPEEAGITVEQAKELGYTEDVNEDPLTDPTQTLSLYPQDIILYKGAGEYLLDVANYIDDLLESYYNKDPYYNANTKEDLIGRLVMGLAPHTSGAVTARIIGYTDTKTNQGHPFFHAAKRRNCFHPDTQLTLKINQEWTEMSIGEFVDTYMDEDKAENYDHGELVQKTNTIPEIDEVYTPSMNAFGSKTLQKITHINKHPTRKHMVKITTQHGDTFKVTPDHKFPVYDQTETGITTQKQAKDLTPNDKLFQEDTNSVSNIKDYKQIDLLEELLQTDIDTESLTVKGIRKDTMYDMFENKIKPEWDNGQFYTLQSSAKHLGLTKKALSNYIYRESIPVELLLKIFKSTENMLEWIPNHVQLGIKRDNVETPRIITLDEELAMLLGYYVAEGNARNQMDDLRNGNPTGVNQVNIAATEEEARKFIMTALENKFNYSDYYKNEKEITISGQIIKRFFTDIVKCGRICTEKHIPIQVKNSSNAIKGAFLSGYISGDGSYGYSKSISMTTVSETLKNNLQKIFKSIDMQSNTYENEPVLLREKFPEFYDENCKERTKSSYTVRLSASDSKKFNRRHGIQIRRKERIPRNYDLSQVESVEHIEADCQYNYNLTVQGTNKLSITDINTNVHYYTFNSDGDEDCTILYIDGLLNFSEMYLPDRIGRRSVLPETEVYVEGDVVGDSDGFEGLCEIKELFNDVNSSGLERVDDGYPDNWEVVDTASIDLKTVSFNSYSGSVSSEGVSSVMRHPCDKDVYEVVFSDGSVQMTGDHGLFTVTDSNIVSIDVRELSVGDEVVVPNNEFMRRSGLDSTEFDSRSDGVVSHLRGGVGCEEVVTVREIEHDGYVYDLSVPSRENFLCGPYPVFAHNTMDAPLVVTEVIDFEEIDDEAWNVEVMDGACESYPREFYELTHSVPDAGDERIAELIDIAEERVGADSDELIEFGFTHEAGDINEGPATNSYVSTSGMDSKVELQMDAVSSAKGIDERIVAKSIVDDHLFPDTIGTLTAYTKQGFRCTNCENIYDRIPLDGSCKDCGKELIFTVHEGGVRRYLDLLETLVYDYDLDPYTEQRCRTLLERIDLLFDNEESEQSDLSEFI